MSDLTLTLSDRYPYVFVEGDLGEPVRRAIDEELSYYVDGHEYSDAWQNDEWDGMHHLFRQAKNGAWYFPVGVLDRVQAILETYGAAYETEGLTRPGRGDIDFEWDSDIELYDYQREAVDEAFTHGSGTIVMPTGSGKTIVGLYLMSVLRRSSAVFVHRKEIADQWVGQIQDVLGVDPAVCYGGVREAGDVQVALYQSVLEEGEVRDDVRLDHDVVLFDEAHVVGADTFSAVAMAITAPYRFGFTATPEREDNATLRVIAGAGPIIADCSVERLIEQGDLAEPEWIIQEAPSSGSRYRNWQTEYKEEIVTNHRRNRLIQQTVADASKPCLVTVERIAHGEHLEALIDGAAFVHGDSSDRDERIQAFRDGDLDVLVATRGIVGEGFDVPEIASICIAGGLKSETSMIQQVGRSLRTGETGTAEIIDFIDRGVWIAKHSEKRIRAYQDYYGEYGP